MICFAAKRFRLGRFAGGVRPSPLLLTARRAGVILCGVALGFFGIARVHADQTAAYEKLSFAGKSKEAADLLETELTSATQQKGPESVEALGWLRIKAVVVSGTKKEEGLALATTVHEKLVTLVGEENTDTLRAQNALAYCLSLMGRFDEAEPMMRDALEKQRRVAGAQNEYTLRTLSNLAGLLSDTKRNAEAAPLWREVLSGREKALDPDHPHTRTTHAELASCLAALGDYPGAIDAFRPAWERDVRVTGESSQAALSALNYLGMLERLAGRFTDAEKHIRAALEGRRKTLGPDHADVAQSLMNLAMLFRQTKRNLEAVAPLVQALEIRRQIGGVGSYLEGTLGDLARFYQCPSIDLVDWVERSILRS